MNYFLDYTKQPSDLPVLAERPGEWIVASTFAQFIEQALKTEPTFIAFGDMTGSETMSCVGWYIDYCERTKRKFPPYAIFTVNSLRRHVEGAIVQAGNDGVIQFATGEEKIDEPVVEEKPSVMDERVAIMKQRGKALASQRESDERAKNFRQLQDKQIAQKRKSMGGIQEDTTVEINENHVRRRGRPPKTIDSCWSTVAFVEESATGSLSNKFGPFYAIDLQGKNLGEVKIGKRITFPAGTFYIAREP